MEAPSPSFSEGFKNTAVSIDYFSYAPMLICLAGSSVEFQIMSMAHLCWSQPMTTLQSNGVNSPQWSRCFFVELPSSEKSSFCWLSPGPPSAPELTFAHAAVKNFISNPPFLCGAPLTSDRPLSSRSLVLSGIGFLERTLCRTQHKKNRHWRTTFVGCCTLCAAPHILCCVRPYQPWRNR